MSKPFVEIWSTNENMPFRLQVNELAKGASFPSHLHKEIEILHFTLGVTTINKPNKTITGVPGQIAIVNSNEIHSFESQFGRCKYDCLQINIDFLKNNGIDIEHSKFNSIIEDAELNSNFVALRDAFHTPSRYTALKKSVECLRLFIALSDKYIDTEPILENDAHISAVSETIKYIQEHLYENLTIEKICSQLHYSQSYIYKSFKSITHHTIFDIINRLRCDAARDLLLTTDISVSECALQCGFSNFSYFTRTYRKYIKELPSATKKKYSQIAIAS